VQAELGKYGKKKGFWGQKKVFWENSVCTLTYCEWNERIRGSSPSACCAPHETARLSVCARQVRSSILFRMCVALWPSCVGLSRYVSSPVASGTVWSSQNLHVSGKHESGGHSYRPPPRDLGVRGSLIVRLWTLVFGCRASTRTYIAFAVPFML